MNEKLKMDWTVNGLLAVILVLLSGTYIGNFAANRVHAEGPGTGGGWETNGIMVTTGNVNERLVLVDTTKKNIMIYHYRVAGGVCLSGVRNYKYDVEIEDTGTKKLDANGWTYFQAMEEFNKQHPQ